MHFNRASGRKETNPYRGIIWAAVFCGALLIIVYAGRQLMGPSEENGDRTTAPLPPKERVSAPAQPKIEPKTDELPRYLTDASVLEEMVDSEDLNSYAFAHLLYQLKKADKSKLANEVRPLPPRDQIGKTKTGAYVSLEGTVRVIRPREDLAVPKGGIPAVTQYEIEDAKKNTHLVFTVYKAQGVRKQDRVSVLGRYYRLYPYLRAGELDATKEAPTPVIVAREVDGSRYLNDPSCLEAVNDGTNGLEAKAFYYLANLVKKMTQEEIKKRVDGTLTPEILRRSPAGARGRLVAIEGALMWKQPEDEPPNIAGIDRLYWCILRGEGGERVWVYAVEEPEGIKKRDIVKAYGVFFKTYRYSDRQYRERIALVMMARRLVRVEYKHAPHLAIAAVIIGVITLAALVIAVMIERKKGRQFGKHVQQLSAKTRPKDLNQAARAIASRTRQAREAVEQAPEKDKPPEPSEPEGVE